MKFLKKPTLQETVQQSFWDAQHALLTAQADFERAKHSLALHQERLARLAGILKGEAPPVPSVERKA